MREWPEVAAAGVACLALTVSAHHSHGQYAETFQDIEGVVKELHLLTPHSWLYIEVKDAKGAPQLWALEATTRAQLGRSASRATIKSGDTIKARCHPLRDKTNGCLLGFLKTKDGTVKDWDGGNAPRPRIATMRLTALVFGWLLLTSSAAAAQEWQEYEPAGRLPHQLPGQPTITTSTWTSQLNYMLPARTYSAERGRERYSVAVVDYSSIEQQGIERAKSCPPGNANCRANAPATLGAGYATTTNAARSSTRRSSSCSVTPS